MTIRKKRNGKRTNRKKSARRTFSRRRFSFACLVGGLLLVAGLAIWGYPLLRPKLMRLRAMCGDVEWPQGKVRGLDLSHYQGKVDWQKVREATLQGAPVSFVFIKATEGTSIVDEQFHKNFREARDKGIMRGAYHYFSTLSSGEEQARFFCETVRLEYGDLPPVLDVEERGKLNPQQLRSEAMSWLAYVERHYGVTPILYTNHSFKLRYLNTPQFNRYPYWIAHYYVKKLKYNGDWAFWQHSDLGKVDGIKGCVDVNVFNGNYQDLVNLTIMNDTNPHNGTGSHTDSKQ